MAKRKPADDRYIEGRMLVATPAMADERFRHSVIYMCRHNDEGALGIVVNRALVEPTPAELFEELGLGAPATPEPTHVVWGGPVEVSHGLVLHSAEYRREETLMVGHDRFGLTASLEILRDMARGAGPATTLLALGHSGWGPGQLDRELQDNAWLVVPAEDEAILFDGDYDGKWTRALGKLGDRLGADPGLFSSTAGRA